MRNIIVSAIAVLGLAACSSAPYQPYDGRVPAGVSNDVSASIKDSAAAVGQVSLNSLEYSADGLRLVSNSVVDLTKAGSNLAVAGVGVSRDVATIVFEAGRGASQSTSAAARRAGDFIVTTGGKVIHFSEKVGKSALNSSKTAVGVSVEVTEVFLGASKTASVIVWDASKVVVIGSLVVSGRAAEKLLDWAKRGARFSLDVSGNLVHESGEVLGQVWDGSKHAVGFVVDASGKILTFSADKSVQILTSTSEGVKDLAKAIWGGLKTSGHFSVEVTKASIQGSAVILKASGQSVMIVADTIGGFFQDHY